MHPATKALSEQLQSQKRCAPPSELLADELQQALAEGATTLELNRIHTDRQTLLPKSTVTIVIKERQANEAEGVIGSESRALATALASAGHRVTLIVIGGPTAAETPELSGIRVRHIKGKGCSREELLRRVASWLRDHPCDVVHLHTWPGLASGLRKALHPNPPQLIVGLSDANKEKVLEIDGLQQADWLISPSQAMATWAGKHFLNDQQLDRLVVNESCPSAQQQGAAESYPIELSWQAFHERLPRRPADGPATSTEQAKATAGPKDSAASPWRQLLNRIRRR